MSASKGALFGGALWQRILLGRAQLLGYLDRYYQVFMWNRRLQHFHCHSAGSQSYASAAAGKSYDMATLDPSSRESEMTRPWTSP
ncbi:hypothetical protein BN1708_000801 [Verticillium longisporum]|uniref:Uncharacterized protein n=1 Tax=Verticillium longisporum TaxID=100787 RepID=A0A0G4M823_VERLO|nr:hypothetical protein BN1708_000801 [Verticillium longisporum]